VILFLCPAVLVWQVPQQGLGGDWPQILGPSRNGTASQDETLADSWPEDGPPLVWEAQVGRGFAGAAISGGQVVLFYRTGDQEVVETRDAVRGTVTWSKQYPTEFEPQYGRDDGPLCVPTISGERVVTLGAGGILTCWNLADGEVVWRIDTQRDFNVLEGYFGVGSCPLVHDGMVIVNVGARDDEAGLVAFAIETGEVVWSAISDGASYSSPVIADISREPVVVALTRFKCVGVSAEDGSLKFNVTAANPLLIGDSLFLSASYGVGAVYGDLGAEGFESVWSNDEIMSSQYTTCIEHDGMLFGVDGRQDIPPAVLRCFDPRTRDVRWSVGNFGYATLLKADGKLLVSKTDGEFILAALSAEGFQPLARAQLFNDTVRALPALANGRLYSRDSERLRCFDLRPPTAE
jgi:outer membrane protein assembly factor BamB